MPLIVSITIQIHRSPVADGQARLTGTTRHQTPNATSPQFKTTKPSSRSDEMRPLINLAGGKDSQSRPMYSSTEWAA